MFKSEFKNEWQRLNPDYVRPEDSLLSAMWHAGKETVPDYLGPARLAWRPVKRGLRAISRFLKKGGQHG